VYIQVINPVDNKTHLSPKEAERLVYRGAASFIVADDGTRRLRYLQHYEEMRLRADMDVAYEEALHERIVNVGRGGKIQGEWHPRQSGFGMLGSPQGRAQQFEMTLDWIADGTGNL
jgi:hypothetical protein